MFTDFSMKTSRKIFFWIDFKWAFPYRS